MDGYRFFDVTVRQRIELSPTLRRFVLAGAGLGCIRRPAPDLYLKIFFPSATVGLDQLSRGEDWYARQLSRPPAARVAMRTFTVRALDAAADALVVDFALHGALGPASRWAQRAGVGDGLVLYAPVSARWGRGYTWRLPARARRVLVVADECALPAAAGIIEAMAESRAGVELTALLEVPLDTDRLALPGGAGHRLRWLPRQREEALLAYGDGLRAGVLAWLGIQGPSIMPGREWEVEGEAPLLWELARGQPGSCYVWMAAETAVAGQLRRLLIAEGVGRESISCMGYWRKGRAQV